MMRSTNTEGEAFAPAQLTFTEAELVAVLIENPSDDFDIPSEEFSIKTVTAAVTNMETSLFFYTGKVVKTQTFNLY